MRKILNVFGVLAFGLVLGCGRAATPIASPAPTAAPATSGAAPAVPSAAPALVVATPAAQRTATAPVLGTAARVQVRLDDSTLKPSLASVPAGEVTFDVTNSGTLPHELVAMKTDLAVGALKLEVDGARIQESAPGQEDVGEVQDIAPGQAKGGTLLLTPGHYLLVCNIPGHFKAGMVAAFEVK